MLLGHACSAVWDTQPVLCCPGSWNVCLVREQLVEESLIAYWAVVVRRQVCALGMTAGWHCLKSCFGASLPRCRHGPVVSYQVRDAGEMKVQRLSQESLGASDELLAESRSQKVPPWFWVCLQDHKESKLNAYIVALGGNCCNDVTVKCWLGRVLQQMTWP